MTCSCADDSGGFSSLLSISAVRQHLVKADAAMAAATEERVVRIGGYLAIGSAIENGKRGCFTIPFLGVPVQLCWEIITFEVTDKVINVTIRIAASAAGQQFMTKTLVFHCSNPQNPQSCTVQVEDSDVRAAIEALSIGCDWGCLKKCAPGCIACGTNYWCWAGCAASCALKCCHL